MRGYVVFHCVKSSLVILLLLIVVVVVNCASVEESPEDQPHLFRLRRLGQQDHDQEQQEELQLQLQPSGKEIQYYDTEDDPAEEDDDHQELAAVHVPYHLSLRPFQHLLRRDDDHTTTNNSSPLGQRNLLTRVLETAVPSLQNTLLGSLVSYFTPALRQTLQDTLKKDFDPFVISNSTTQDLGEVFTIGACKTTAKIIYDSEILKGLASVQLDKVEMVEDSDEISYSIFDGATWSCNWVFNATFRELKAAANATLHVDACGTPAMEHKLNFTARIEKPSIYMEIKVNGDTSNLILFQSTSQISKARVLDLDFKYHMVDAKLAGNFGNLSYVNLGVEMGETIYKDSGVFEKLMREAIQAALKERLPFKPQGSF